MGVGAGGLALLATFTDDAIEEIYYRHQAEYENSGYTLAKLLQQVQETRDDGYSQIVSTITPGISGVGHAFYLSKITRVAISFGVINARLDEKRRKQMGQLLKAECEAWLQNV